MVRVAQLLLGCSLLLATGSATAQPAAAPAGSGWFERSATDGCSAEPPGPLYGRLQDGEDALAAQDTEAARKAAGEVAAGAGGDLWLRLRAGSVLARAGDAEGAKKLFEGVNAAAAKAPAAHAQAGKLYRAAAQIELGSFEAGSALLAEVRGVEGAEAANACHFIAAAFALDRAGKRDEARELLGSVLRSAPKARSVLEALISLHYAAKDDAAVEATLRAGLRAYPEDAELVARLANLLKVTDRAGEARALLEKRIFAGEQSPAVLGELLGMVSGQGAAADMIERYTKLATENPNLPALSMFVGVMHHYKGDFAASNEWLAKTGRLADMEPRIPMYMAMNNFRLGNQAEAERLIAKAATTGRPDPDIHYCMAVIHVRNDPARAKVELERYLALTEGRRDVSQGKQGRVKKTLEMVAKCVAADDPKACIETDVIAKASRLAFEGHFGKDGEGPTDGDDGAAPDGKDDAAAPGGDTDKEPAAGDAAAAGTEKAGGAGAAGEGEDKGAGQEYEPGVEDAGGYMRYAALAGGALFVVVLLLIALRSRRRKQEE